MTARTLIGADFKILGTGKATITSPTAGDIDFGTPNDLKIAAGSLYKGSDRIMVVLSASTAGTTSTLTATVLDAPDNAGSIGTTAAAITNGNPAAVSGTYPGGTGDHFQLIGVTLQQDRPWLRITLTPATATDVFVVHALVLAIPAGF